MTQQQESVITDEMREAVGKESEPMTLEVEKTGCRMFARAVGHTDRIFYDEDYARSRGHRSVVAPPGFLGTPVFSPGSGGGRQGPPGRGFSIPYKRVLNGGTEYEYLDTVCAGDVLQARSKVAAFTERSGSIGPMLITERETTYTNQDGKVVAKMHGTTIQY
ncbi:MAG: MaoC family dehydratase N-terminal domain-containing protein [Dehalococcoidia bacterium]